MLELVFAERCAHFAFPYEFLRVHSPSAEVRQGTVRVRKSCRSASVT